RAHQPPRDWKNRRGSLRGELRFCRAEGMSNTRTAWRRPAVPPDKHPHLRAKLTSLPVRTGDTRAEHPGSPHVFGGPGFRPERLSDPQPRGTPPRPELRQGDLGPHAPLVTPSRRLHSAPTSGGHPPWPGEHLAIS